MRCDVWGQGVVREGGSLRQLCVGSRVCTAHVAGRVARAAAALLRSTPRGHMAQRTGCRGGMRGGVAERGDPRASRTPGAPRRARTRRPHGAATRGGGAFPPAGKKKKMRHPRWTGPPPPPLRLRQRTLTLWLGSRCCRPRGLLRNPPPRLALPARSSGCRCRQPALARVHGHASARAHTPAKKKIARSIGRHGHAAHIAQRAIERCRGWG